MLSECGTVESLQQLTDQPGDPMQGARLLKGNRVAAESCSRCEGLPLALLRHAQTAEEEPLAPLHWVEQLQPDY